MPSQAREGWVFPIGHALVTASTATQRDLVDVLARARTAELCGLLALTSTAWQGHMLLFGGVPHFAHATNQKQSESLLDRDAYEQLCLSFGPDPTSQLYLYRIDERLARALSGMFQSSALRRRLESASELRFLLEIVGGCHFEGCLQFQAGDDRAIVLFHQGRPLGAYTAQERQIVTSLAGPLASILGKPNPDVVFFPRNRTDPLPLNSSDSLDQVQKIAGIDDHHRPLVDGAEPGRALIPPRYSSELLHRENDRGDLATLQSAMPTDAHAPMAQPLEPHDVSTFVTAMTTTSAASSLVSPVHTRGPTTPAQQAAHLKHSTLDKDIAAESQMLWLLTSLDRQWGQLKDKGLDDPAILTSLAGMVSLCLAKVESVRIGMPDVAADPLDVEAVVDYIRTRFPTAGSLRAHGSRVDATPLLHDFQALNGQGDERAWLLVCAEGLTAGLRFAFDRLVEQVQSDAIQHDMRETYDIYLADVERELHRKQTSMDSNDNGQQGGLPG